MLKGFKCSNMGVSMIGGTMAMVHSPMALRGFKFARASVLMGLGNAFPKNVRTDFFSLALRVTIC